MGFTLVELLIVIAILAILAVAVVLILNPIELIRQARDTTRISDLSAVHSALAVLLVDVPTLTWNVTSTCAIAAGSGATASSTFPASTTSPIASTTVSGILVAQCWYNGSQVNTGTGWVAVNFTQMTGGAPIGKLPVDPVNSTSSANCASAGSPAQGCYYAYKASSTTGIYELNANMESIKYSQSGAGDVESVDGGNRPDWYEVGSSLVL